MTEYDGCQELLSGTQAWCGCAPCRVAVGNQLEIRVFRKRFPYLNIVELRARAYFSKRQLLESHLHIADYGLASLDGFQHLPSRPACLVCHVGHVRGLGS